MRTLLILLILAGMYWMRLEQQKEKEKQLVKKALNYVRNTSPDATKAQQDALKAAERALQLQKEARKASTLKREEK